MSSTYRYYSDPLPSEVKQREKLLEDRPVITLAKYDTAPGHKQRNCINECCVNSSSIRGRNFPFNAPYAGQPFRNFLALPFSLREAIYNFALVRGKIYPLLSKWLQQLEKFDYSVDLDMLFRLRDVGHLLEMERIGHEVVLLPFAKSSYDSVTAGLMLGVSRQVQKEAEDVFYGRQNLFVLPTGPFREIDRFFAGRFGRSTFLRSVRRVNIALDSKDFWRASARTYRTLSPEIYRAESLATESGRREIIHDRMLSDLGRWWHSRLFRLFDNTDCLEHLEIDLAECYCPTGMLSDGQWAR